MNDDRFSPLPEGTPRSDSRGGWHGGSPKTLFIREQLKGSPGKWFIWKTGARHGSDTGQALRTLMGKQSLTGIDRKTLPYQATAQMQDNGTYTTFVRYVGENREHATPIIVGTPLATQPA